MNHQDLLATLEDLIENCCSSNNNSTEVFSILATYLFLTDKDQNAIDDHFDDVLKNIYVWFKTLREEYQRLSRTLPSMSHNNDALATRLKYYFLGMSYNPLLSLFGDKLIRLGDMYSKIIPELITFITTDLERDAHAIVPLIYSLYQMVPQINFHRDLSNFISSPEVSSHLLKCLKRVSSIQTKLYELFSSEDADQLMALAANKSGIQSDEYQNDISLSKSSFLTETDISGWGWFAGNSKNLTEKLKYAVKILRRFLMNGEYQRALSFNSE